MTTNVTIYNENGTLIGNFTGGRIREIKIHPDEIRIKLKEKTKSKIEESGTEIELENDGNYKVKAKKESRLFWMLKVREKIEARVNSETGETEINSPWWGFMGNDIEED